MLNLISFLKSKRRIQNQVITTLIVSKVQSPFSRLWTKDHHLRFNLRRIRNHLLLRIKMHPWTFIMKALIVEFHPLNKFFSRTLHLNPNSQIKIRIQSPLISHLTLLKSKTPYPILRRKMFSEIYPLMSELVTKNTSNLTKGLILYRATCQVHQSISSNLKNRSHYLN